MDITQPPEPELYRGTSDGVEYLVTIWPSGDMELATRPHGSGQSWSAPVLLAKEPTW